MAHMPNFIHNLAHCVTSRRQNRGGERSRPTSRSNSPCPLAPTSIARAEDFRPNDSYLHIKDLQEGRDGQCSIVKSVTTSKFLVLKQTRSCERPGRRKLPHEVKYLSLLEPHPNIIHIFATEQCPSAPGRHNLYVELCSGGDLLDQLNCFKKKTEVPNREIFTLHVFIGLAQALAYIHHSLRYDQGRYTKSAKRHEPIVHSDIKAENILLRWPGKDCAGLPDIVLADFGLAQLANESWGIAGTPGHDSPEVDAVAELEQSDPELCRQRKNARILTIQSDVYQLGLVMHCLATGWNFKKGDQDPDSIRLPTSHQRIEGLLEAMKWCLQRNPKKRPECSESPKRGMLYLVDLLRVQRDEMAARSSIDKKEWNVLEIESLGCAQR